MKCFVIMPFGNPQIDTEQARKLDLIYSQWIKPTVEAIKDNNAQCLMCHRADKELRPEEIITHIIENLISSDIVIADLSGRNPNVFYELGVRHAVNNNTILIADSFEDIPFDLRGLRTIIYSYEPEHMLRLKSSLDQAIYEILREPDKIDNPVRRFLYNREVDKLIKQTAPPGYDVVKDIIAEVGFLRHEVSNHLSEVRQVMKLITSKEPLPQVGSSERLTLEFFEGAWISEPEGSTYYARVVDGELFMPYCYGGDASLTGHYYNLRVVGETLVGRFEWLKGSSISGYAMNKVVSDDLLTGAWWYAQDLPKEVLREALHDVSKITMTLPRKNEISFHRSPNPNRFPKWAEDYFRNGLYKRDRTE
jgi:hypothetical protein